jgi:putative redox protein
MPRIEKTSFESADGNRLAAIIDLPDETPESFAVFAHCFTCTKDAKAAFFTSRTLAGQGIAVLRFDFAGLGESTGELAESSFSSNVADIVSAADHLRAQGHPPCLLVGHSLGGTAVLVAAPRIPEVRAAVTISSPFDPGHLRRHLAADPVEDAADELEILVSNRRFRLKRRFFDDLAEQDLPAALAAVGDRGLLVCHAPDDTVVSLGEARRILDAAPPGASFVALPGAGHLLLQRAHGDYLGRVIAAWCRAYVGSAPDKAK